MALKPGYWPSALLLVRYSVHFWSTPDSSTVYLRTVYAGSLLPPACCPGPSTRSAQFRLARSRASVPLLNRTAEVSQHTEVELSRCSFLSSMPLLLILRVSPVRAFCLACSPRLGLAVRRSVGCCFAAGPTSYMPVYRSGGLKGCRTIYPSMCVCVCGRFLLYVGCLVAV